MMRRLPIVALVLLLAAAPTVAFAQQRYAVLVEGTSGTPEYAQQHRQWLDGLATVLRDKLDFDAAHLTILSETPRAGEQESTAVNVRKVFGALAGKLSAQDLLFVMLIGHGSEESGTEAKFNLVGPDLDVSEWGALLKPIQGRLVFVDATASSDGFLGLAGPNRIIIVATDSPAMRFHTIFTQGFLEALQSPDADLDKNGRVSIWEAFTYASRQVQAAFQQKGTLQTERAALDDDGDGKGREATAQGTDGSLASITYLDPAPSTRTNDPELKKLLEQQDTLTQQIQTLKSKQAAMAPEAFQQQLEDLETQLAVVSREIRRRGGGG